MRTSRTGTNVPGLERVISAGLGLAAIYFSRARLLRKSPAGWAMFLGGAALGARGLLGRSAAYRLLSKGEPAEVTASVTVQRTRAEVYRFWRDLANLPLFMRHLRSVRVDSPTQSTWRADQGPAKLEWKAEITEEKLDQRLAWRSLPGSDLVHEGSVELRDAPRGRGTEVCLTMRYSGVEGMPLPTALGRLVAKISEPQLRADLFRLRQLLETGEVSTGQRRAEDADEARRPLELPHGAN